MPSQTLKNLLNNNRFYILVLVFLLSIFVACLLRIQIASTELWHMRLEQTFGFLAIAFLYITLTISPFKKIVGDHEWMKNLVFARRALGVSVLYFSLLHTGVAFWGQMGGFEGLAALPERFIWPLIAGLIALGILCIMTVTSFDKMVMLLTYPGWKWVQRLVYACGVLIIMHVWAIGAHFTEPGIEQTVMFVALGILFGLEAWRVAHFFGQRYQWQLTKKMPLFAVLWAAALLALVGVMLIARPVDAHMFSKDTRTNSGAILHITPDDDPIAGEPAFFTFDIENTPLTNSHPLIELTIADDQNQAVLVPAHLQGNAVKAEYTFPRQGLYTIKLILKQNNQVTHNLTISQRVNRGIITSSTVHSVPFWAGSGLLLTVVAALAVTAFAFSRRKIINTYSKL